MPLIKDWSDQELSELLPFAKTVSYKRKTVLYDFGDPCISVYIIKHGEIEVNIIKTKKKTYTR